jgi:HPt (histidine-containing phosphotransfer) domain-containing protein
VLSSYATNTKGQLDELANTVKVGAMDTCAIMFHGIKGSSRGISAETVGAEAETLEIAAKSGNRKYVEDHIHGFIAETDALITAITEMLRSATAQNEKPLKDRPDGELLKKLASACNRFSMDDADITMNELEQFHYKEDGSLVTWLREKVNTMNFEEIVAHLSNEGDL